jgi:hypothetical protein
MPPKRPKSTKGRPKKRKTNLPSRSRQESDILSSREAEEGLTGQEETASQIASRSQNFYIEIPEFVQPLQLVTIPVSRESGTETHELEELTGQEASSAQTEAMTSKIPAPEFTSPSSTHGVPAAAGSILISVESMSRQSTRTDIGGPGLIGTLF